MWHNEFETEPYANGLYFYEPLDTDAPEMARPYCCYTRTVIFYAGPIGLTEELDCIETKWDLLGQRWTDEYVGFATLTPFVKHAGQIYELVSGHVIWRGGWCMRWFGRRVPEDDRRMVVMRAEGLLDL